MSIAILNKNHTSVKPEIISLKHLVERNYFFNIPIYQRLYVWGKQQLQILLEDIVRAADKKEPYFYLGTVIVSKNHTKDNYFDLVDGQQRFTTLWLIGYVLKNNLLPFVYDNTAKTNHPRLFFSIRDYANKYFLMPSQIETFNEDEKKELTPLVDAYNLINGFFANDELKDKVEYYSEYFFKNIKIIFTLVPETTDENKLFEVMNNRGVQLQHHEILKAKLLELVNDDERSKYAQLWDACSKMDSYIERNIKDVCGFKWKEITGRAAGEDKEEELGQMQNILQKISDRTIIREEKHLLDVLNSGTKEDEGIRNSEDKEPLYEAGKVDSIITFPMLLLHSLRIFQYKYHKSNAFPLADEHIASVNEKKLLDIFKVCFFKFYKISEDNKQTELVKDFLDLLFSIRVKFDKYVIKWIFKKDNLKVHSIQRLYLRKDSLYRREPESNEGFALLQSMLYHSQQLITHYWLTPFIYKMLFVDDVNELYDYLKKLDNAMFCQRSDDGLSERSWKMMGNELFYFKNNRINELVQHKGTSFWSYWFYKTDFILWHEFNAGRLNSVSLSEAEKVKWIDYRMTAKNSVEHVSPQNPKVFDNNTVWNKGDDEKMKKYKQDDFGNLVLLSPGMNSEYSNKIYSSKRAEFLEKPKYDSLKSALIFKNEIWNYDLCRKHRGYLFRLFIQYFKNTM